MLRNKLIIAIATTIIAIHAHAAEPTPRSSAASMHATAPQAEQQTRNSVANAKPQIAAADPSTDTTKASTSNSTLGGGPAAIRNRANAAQSAPQQTN